MTTWGGKIGYPTHRCTECTLVRCFQAGILCDECASRAPVSPARRAPLEWKESNEKPYKPYNPWEHIGDGLDNGY